MNSAFEQFKRFFRDDKNGAGAHDADAETPDAEPPADEPPVDTEPVDEPPVDQTPREPRVPDPLRERATRYMTLLAARDVQGLVDSIVLDLDKEQILTDIRDLRAKHPKLSDSQLAELLISRASNAMSIAAVASGLAWAVPGVGIAAGSVATAAEMVAMIVYQSRLVVSVAAVFGHDIRSAERGRDVLVCIASATAGGAVQLGVRAAVQILVERMTAMLARRTATAFVKSVPIAGAVAGLAGGTAAAIFNRLAVRAVGRYAVRFYGTGGKHHETRTPPLLTD